MKRANLILTITASALTLLAAPATGVAQAKAPLHAPANPETPDTLLHSTTKALIESMGELSRTASKLSDAALKLLEAQEKQGGTQPAAPKAPANAKKTASTQSAQTALESETIPGNAIAVEKETPFRNNVYISDGNAPAVAQDSTTQAENSVWEIPANNGVWEIPTSQREGGRYIWVPDKDTEAVEAIVNGDIPDGLMAIERLDLDEKTFWRGDSIPLAIHTKRLGRYDRKLYNWLIYPKRLWHLSLSANYGELSTDDSEFLSLIQDVDMKGKIYSIKPSVSYFIRSNVCVGLRLAFTKGDMAVNSFKVDIDDDMSFNLHDIKYSSDSYSAAAFIQQYFGLSRKGRFAIFNEAEVAVGTGNAHFIRPFDGQIRDTRTKTQNFSINYSPGVSILMMKNAAFNLSFGIFGFHLKNEKQWENGEESGSRFTSGINFRFNIFNINFGVSIVI